MKRVSIKEIRPADHEHQVVTVTGGKGAFRKKPCRGCPWVEENAGTFPAEAFRLSANTACDMAQKQFACHESGTNKPATCAGFLLRGADHNLSVRMARLKGERFMGLAPDERALFADYRAMAIGNGVPADDPAIRDCR